MNDTLSDRYWLEEFQVTQADLDRIANYIRRTGQAHDLTTMARRVVRGRLRYGPETSAPVLTDWVDDASVRLWDPAGEWKVGDHVIVLHFQKKEGKWVNEPSIGEITRVEPHQVSVHLDSGRLTTYQRALPGSEDAHNWRETVQKVVAERLRAPEPEEQAGAVLLTHGNRIAGQLLSALDADQRFVHLAGRWFLRELAVQPTDAQLASLAWAMLSLEEPQPTEALVPLVRPPLAEGDPGLFGLYLAMQERTNLFCNVDSPQYPRWVLAGLPPGSCTPRRAAYDPETYEVLCLPGQSIPPETVRRLWDLDLLRAVM